MEARHRSLVQPVAAWAARAVLLLGLAFFATLYGYKLGADPLLRRPFAATYPTLAAMTHGEAALVARVARAGWQEPADARVFPLVPLVGRLAVAAGQSVEAWLLVASLLACLGACLIIHRCAERRAGPAAASSSLGLALAFPFAFHLSDGGTLAWVALAVAAGVALAERGRPVAASVAVTLGVLAHPAALAATAALVLHGPLARDRRLPAALGWALALAPALAFAGWLAYLARGLALPLDAVVPAFGWGDAPAVTAVAPFALLVLAGTALLFRDGDRGLAVTTAAQAALLLVFGGFAGTRALAACWGAFLPLGARAARHDAVLAPALGVLATFQGLFYYLFTHQFPVT